MAVASTGAELPRRASMPPRLAALTVIVVVTLAALPLVLPSRAVATAVQMAIAALFALAFNVLWRQTRLLLRKSQTPGYPVRRRIPRRARTR